MNDSALDSLRDRTSRLLDDYSIIRWRIGGLIVALAVIGICVVMARQSRPVPSPAAVAAARSTTNTSVSSSTTVAGATIEVVVDVGGAVTTPGLYHLNAGARVADAVAAAGGLLGSADQARVNLAQKLTDGQQVYIAKTGETAPVVTGSPNAATAAVVDLNTATVDELDTLPGVGPATAQAIVRYRTEHGTFASVDDLTAVGGIGPAKLAQLKDRVRV